MDAWTPESAVPDDLKAYIAGIPQESSEESEQKRLFAFMHIVQRLKTTARTGWVNFQVPNPESIADHMYRMAILGFFAPQPLDTAKCVKIALVHDMAEALVGDITPVDPIPKGEYQDILQRVLTIEEKHRRELTTMQYIKDLLFPAFPKVAQELYDLWLEYENIASPEARFIKDIDKFELICQTQEYEHDLNQSKDLGQFLSVRDSVKTPTVSSWADALIDVRNKSRQ